MRSFFILALFATSITAAPRPDKISDQVDAIKDAAISQISSLHLPDVNIKDLVSEAMSHALVNTRAAPTPEDIVAQFMSAFGSSTSDVQALVAQIMSNLSKSKDALHVKARAAPTPEDIVAQFMSAFGSSTSDVQALVAQIASNLSKSKDALHVKARAAPTPEDIVALMSAFGSSIQALAAQIVANSLKNTGI